MNNKEQVQEQLAGLRERVTWDDKLQASVALNVHFSTIDRYLKNGVKKESLGLKLLGFLKKKIADRETALA